MLLQCLSVGFELGVLLEELLREEDLKLFTVQILRRFLTVLGRGGANRTHEVQQLLHVLTGREERLPRLQLIQHTGQTPHIYRVRIRPTKDDLRRTVVSRLEVSVKLLPVETTRPEVSKLQTRLAPFLHENVLGLDVAMHHALLAEEKERVEELHREQTDRVVVEREGLVGTEELVEVAV